MKYIRNIQSKILNGKELNSTLARWRLKGHPIIFTNGCFDLIHPGHLSLLTSCKDYGGKLIIGLNSDASVKRLKGQHRPIKDEESRALLLASLVFVDAVVIFEEDTPLNLIKAIAPEILLKGGDWDVSQIVGADQVLSYGGQVETIPFVDGFSTTNLEEKIKSSS